MRKASRVAQPGAILLELVKVCSLDRQQFPGPMPISISSRTVIRELFTGFQDWVVLPKSDGTRYLLFVTMFLNEPRAFLINRASQVWSLEEKWHKSWLASSLFDGELVNDEYQIFDCFSYFGQSCAQEDFVTRMEIARLAVQRNRASWITVKPFYPVQETQKVWQDVASTRKYDGLIFVRVGSPLTHKQKYDDPWLLKWKPIEHQTIDCLVRVTENENKDKDTAIMPIELCVLTGRELQVWAKSFVSVEKLREFGCMQVQELHERIVECSTDGLTLFQIRKDKTQPNTFYVARKTEAAVKAGIMIEDFRC